MRRDEERRKGRQRKIQKRKRSTEKQRGQKP